MSTDEGISPLSQAEFKESEHLVHGILKLSNQLPGEWFIPWLDGISRGDLNPNECRECDNVWAEYAGVVTTSWSGVAKLSISFGVAVAVEAGAITFTQHMHTNNRTKKLQLLQQ